MPSRWSLSCGSDSLKHSSLPSQALQLCSVVATGDEPTSLCVEKEEAPFSPILKRIAPSVDTFGAVNPFFP